MGHNPRQDIYNNFGTRQFSFEMSNLQVVMKIVLSLGPVYEFVCISFRTNNLNCFRVS